jgi:hypothetical protein
MVRSGLTLIAAIGALSPAWVAAAEPSCGSQQQRQFDFWIGDWDVTVGGQPAGRNRIERILDGCALLENWTGAGGMSGKSLNFYDTQRAQWHQTWVDDRGGSLGLDGTFSGGKMVLSGSKKDKEGKTVVNRIIWTALPNDQVRQVWETSTDEGKSWTTAFDGIYTRRR